MWIYQGDMPTMCENAVSDAASGGVILTNPFDKNQQGQKMGKFNADGATVVGLIAHTEPYIVLGVDGKVYGQTSGV